MLRNLAPIGILAAICPTAIAADYEMIASGPLISASSDSSTFDGTNHGMLPPALNLSALDGGSFTATFRFSTVTPIAGSLALYPLLPPAGMTSFDLRNPAGQVVHHGSGPFEADATVENNYGSPPFSVDQVFLASQVNSITGSIIPAPIYSPSGDLILATDLSFSGYVSGGTQYLTDLSIPTNPAIYLAFPNRTFDLLIEFGDGDYLDQIGPYQLIDTVAQYEITSLAVTRVPEAGLISVLFPALSAVAIRRRRTASPPFGCDDASPRPPQRVREQHSACMDSLRWTGTALSVLGD